MSTTINVIILLYYWLYHKENNMQTLRLHTRLTRHEHHVVGIVVGGLSWLTLEGEGYDRYDSGV